MAGRLGKLAALSACIGIAMVAGRLPAGDPPGPATSSSPTSRPIDAKVAAKLICLLNDDSYQVREQATLKLMDLGPDVADIVRSRLAEGGLALEVKIRLRRVLESADLIEGLAGRRFTEYGWSAGAANDGDVDKVSYFSIVSASKSGGVVTLTYQWRQGSLELRRHGQTLRGTWRQDNDTGAIEFTFDASGKFVSGRWRSNQETPEKWYKAFLR